MRSLVRGRRGISMVLFSLTAVGIGIVSVGCSSRAGGADGDGAGSATVSAKTRAENLAIDQCAYELAQARADYSAKLSSQIKPADEQLTAAEQDAQSILLRKLSHLEDSFRDDELPTSSLHLKECAQKVETAPLDKDPSHYPKDLPRCDAQGNCTIPQIGGGITTKADPIDPGCPPASPDFNCKAVVDAAYGSWSQGMDPANSMAEGGGYQCDTTFWSTQRAMSGFSTSFDLFAHTTGGYRLEQGWPDNDPGGECHKQSRTLVGGYQLRWIPYVKFVPRFIWNPNQRPGAPANTPVGWVANTNNETTFVRDGVRYPARCTSQADDTVTVASRVTPVMNLPYSVILNVYEAGSSSPYVRRNGNTNYKAEVNADYTCFGPGTGADGFTHTASDVRNQQDLFVQADCTDTSGWNANASGQLDVGARPGGNVGFGGGVHSSSHCHRGGGNPKQAIIGCIQPNTFSVNLTTGPITPGGNLAADAFKFQKGTRDDGDHGALGMIRLGMQWNALYSYANSTPSFPGFSYPAKSVATVKAGDFNVGQAPNARVGAAYKLELDMEACTLKRNGTAQGGDSCVVNTKIWKYANPTAGEPTAAQLSAILRGAGLE